MPNFQPDLVWDESRATGWARVELSGDLQYARALVPWGRKVLGQMKAMHGVNQRQVDEAGNTGGGGFYHRWAALPDGAMAHVITNDGHDTIQIIAPQREEREKAKRMRQDVFEVAPYLWVGIRVKDGCTRPWFALNTIMVEPATDPGGLRGWITQGVGVSGWVYQNFPHVSGMPDNPVFTPDSGDLSLDGLLDGFQNFAETSLVQADSAKTRGDHNFCLTFYAADAESTGHTVGFSANGLLMQDRYLSDSDVFLGTGPYDPLMNEQQNAGGERDFSTEQDPFFTQPGGADWRAGWDVTYWIDPFDYKKEGRLFDGRPFMQALTAYLRDQRLVIKEGPAQALSGVYKLGIFAFDTPPEEVSDRSGEAIPEDPVNGPVGLTRSTYCDYQSHLSATNSWPSLEVEVEVRLGRSKMTMRSMFDAIEEVDLEAVIDVPAVTYNFTLIAERYDDRVAVVTPFGQGAEYDSCIGDGGPNMEGPSFSQWIDIDVNALTAAIAGEGPSPGIGGGNYNSPVGQKLYQADIYVYGGIFPQPDDASFPALAGAAIFSALEAMSSGAYGCSIINGFTAGEITDSLAGAVHDHVYHFNPEDGTVSDLGPPATSPADWAANDPPADSTNFYWFYEHAVGDKNNCHNTMGVLVISTGEAFYEGSQNYTGMPGYTEPDCC